MSLAIWYDATAPTIATQLASSPRAAQAALAGSAVHLAVLAEPFLGFVLDGSKRIESRFSTMRAAPFRMVHAGDLLLLKAPSGSIVAATLATEVSSYAALTTGNRVELRARFGRDLRDDVPGFWEQREAARFATLIRLAEVIRFATPLACPKRDRRGWVVLRQRTRQLSLLG